MRLCGLFLVRTEIIEIGFEWNLFDIHVHVCVIILEWMSASLLSVSEKKNSTRKGRFVLEVRILTVYNKKNTTISIYVSLMSFLYVGHIVFIAIWKCHITCHSVDNTLTGYCFIAWYACLWVTHIYILSLILKSLLSHALLHYCQSLCFILHFTVEVWWKPIWANYYTFVQVCHNVLHVLCRFALC